MKKTVKGQGMKRLFWGVSVLAAVLILATCGGGAGGGGDTLKTLSGNITISPSSGVTTGTELTANYSGSEIVAYQWNKGGNALPGTAEIKYIPGEAGSYTVMSAGVRMVGGFILDTNDISQKHRNFGFLYLLRRGGNLIRL